MIWALIMWAKAAYGHIGEGRSAVAALYVPLFCCCCCYFMRVAAVRLRDKNEYIASIKSNCNHLYLLSIRRLPAVDLLFGFVMDDK